MGNMLSDEMIVRMVFEERRQAALIADALMSDEQLAGSLVESEDESGSCLVFSERCP